MARRPVLSLCLLALLLLGAIALRLAQGGWGDSPEITRSLLELRAMRVGAAVCVGAALAVAGVMLQSLLRNPLASPDLLGLASGSGLGIMIAVYLAHLAGLGIASASGVGATAAALLGAILALVLVYTLSQRRGLLEPVTLILVGVMISILCSAGILFIKHLLPDRGEAADRLIMGALRDDLTLTELSSVGVVTLAGLVVGVALGRAMDVASLGDDESRSVGLSLGSLRVILFASSGVLTAGSVLLAGPIGFVGLICPHAVRLIAGPNHRVLIVGAALAGALLMVLADSLVRLVELPSGRLPISVITSLIGGPTLIVLLRRGDRGF